MSRCDGKSCSWAKLLDPGQRAGKSSKGRPDCGDPCCPARIAYFRKVKRENRRRR